MRRVLFLLPSTKKAMSAIEEAAKAVLADIQRSDSIRVVTSTGSREMEAAAGLTATLCALSPQLVGLPAQQFRILGGEGSNGSSSATILGQVDAFTEQVVVVVASEQTIYDLYLYLCRGYGFAPEPITDKYILIFKTGVLTL